MHSSPPSISCSTYPHQRSDWDHARLLSQGDLPCDLPVSKNFSRALSRITSRSIGRVLSLDCEMVGVGPEGLNSALARVTVMDYDEKIVLDTFVQVDDIVTDYRTYVSGIAPSDLTSSNLKTMTKEECRYLVSILLKGRIVIGNL